MPRIRNVVQGAKARAQGLHFENWVKREAYAQGFSVIQIPLGCKQVAFNRLIRVYTPFDFVFARRGQCIFADAKHCSDDNFSYSRITRHQAVNLKDLEDQGFPSGYIVCFSKESDWTRAETRFFTATQLVSIDKRESLKRQQGILIGERGRIFLSKVISGYYPQPLPLEEMQEKPTEDLVYPTPVHTHRDTED